MKIALSPRTRRFKRISAVTGILSLATAIAPLVVFGVIAWAEATPTQKVTISFMAMAAIIIATVNVLMKAHARSPFWIIVLALTWILKEIAPVIVLMAICSLADELVLAPLHKWAKARCLIGKEIDVRG